MELNKKRRPGLRSSEPQNIGMDVEQFKLNLLEALNDDAIAKKFGSVFNETIKDLKQSVDTLIKLNKTLTDSIQEKDDKIKYLEKRCDDLEDRVDDLEQWGRRGSMRIQGLPETGSGTVEDKVLALVNDELKLQPPLQLEDIEVAHRLPHPRAVLERHAAMTAQQQ